MKRYEKILNYITFRIFLGFLWVSRNIPYFLAIKTARGACTLLWLFDSFHRKIAQVQMKTTLGENYKKGMDLEVFKNHGDLLIDAIRYSAMSDDQIKSRISIEGRQNLDEALASGKGIMLVTGHICNWELLGHMPTLLGIEFSLMSDLRDNPALDAIVERLRAIPGLTVLPPKGMTNKLITELLNCRMIGFIIDQRPSRGKEIYCDYFGLPAPTNPAPAFIAMKGNAVILPVYIIKHDNRFTITFEKPFEANSFEGSHAVFDLSSHLQKWVESVVTKYPQYWSWLYSRWLRRSQIRKVVHGEKDFKKFVFETNTPHS